MKNARSQDDSDRSTEPQAAFGRRGFRVAPPVFPPLLNESQTAALLGVSPRTLLKLRGEPWFPSPLQLGPRATRWLRDELLEALATRAPRGGIQPKPPNLIDRETR